MRVLVINVEKKEMQSVSSGFLPRVGEHVDMDCYTPLEQQTTKGQVLEVTKVIHWPSKITKNKIEGHIASYKNMDSELKFHCDVDAIIYVTRQPQRAR